MVKVTGYMIFYKKRNLFSGMVVKILLIFGIVVGIYAIFNNIGGVFSAFQIKDSTLMTAKLLQSLLPVIAGAVIVWVSALNLYDLIFKKKD